MKKNQRKNSSFKSFGLLLAIALIFRIILSIFGVHPDILSQAHWGAWIYKHGPFGFYNYEKWTYEWPSQPPLVNLFYGFSLNLHDSLMGLFSNLGGFIANHHLGAGHLLFYFNFVQWFGAALYSPTDILLGQIILIKFFAILADILIATTSYLLLRQHLAEKKSLLLTGLFLFLPFSWYLSSLWGQYDQIGALFFIGSLILLYKRFFAFSILAILISFQIKPTVALFLPFYIFYFFFQKPGFKNIAISIITFLVTYLITTLPFIGYKEVFADSKIIYLKTFLIRREATLVNHAFNFWSIFFPLGKNIKPSDLIFIFGHSLTILINLWAILILKRDHSLKYLLISTYILTAGSYIFGIGMLDRYFYPAVIILGLNIAFFPKLLWPWILTCLLFSFNLFYSWGYPILQWQFGQAWYNNSDLIIRALSLTQLILFIVVIKIMLGKETFAFGRFWLGFLNKSSR